MTGTEAVSTGNYKTVPVDISMLHRDPRSYPGQTLERLCVKVWSPVSRDSTIGSRTNAPQICEDSPREQFTKRFLYIRIFLLSQLDS